MIEPRVSVVIPTHNRPEKLAETLIHLKCQSLPTSQYEIIVVDDGSSPPLSISSEERGPEVHVLRLGGGERSAARNAGAKEARGELLVFIDDDITVEADFLVTYMKGHCEWKETLLVGAIRLPEEANKTPFGRFRQRLEDDGLPTHRGVTSMPNFCSAANMAISRHRFNELGGFDRNIASSEDQDLALRHTSRGGQIAFLPEAAVVHRDNSLDIQSYCRRSEWGARMMIPFCRRYPDFPDNVVRRETNRRLNLVKIALSARPLIWLLFQLAGILERVAPQSTALDRLYRALLGIHIYRGYRVGERQA